MNPMKFILYNFMMIVMMMMMMMMMMNIHLTLFEVTFVQSIVTSLGKFECRRDTRKLMRSCFNFARPVFNSHGQTVFVLYKLSFQILFKTKHAFVKGSSKALKMTFFHDPLAYRWHQLEFCGLRGPRKFTDYPFLL